MRRGDEGVRGRFSGRDGVEGRDKEESCFLLITLTTGSAKEPEAVRGKKDVDEDDESALSETHAER